MPPTASCVVDRAADVTLTTIVYPADWNTVTEPPALACRYFDPEPITVPADPATLTTAVMVKADPTVPYEDALTAATNPSAWNVLTNEPVTVLGAAGDALEATSTAGSPGYPTGVTRYGYLIDLGGRSTWIETSGTVGDAAYTTNMSVVDLIASQSTPRPRPRARAEPQPSHGDDVPVDVAVSAAAASGQFSWPPRPGSWAA